jgi:hypothetical protein
MLKLTGIRRSNNPTAKVDAKSGWNISSDGRLYYIATFQDNSNPFAPTREKVISQQFDSQHNPIWKGGDPKEIEKFIGKEINAKAVTMKVPSYKVGDRDVNIYTAVVLGHENVETVFKNAGHPLEDVVDTTTGAVLSIAEQLKETAEVIKY